MRTNFLLVLTSLLLASNLVACRHVPPGPNYERDVETYFEEGDDYFHAVRREVLAPKEAVGPKQFDTNPYDVYSISADPEEVSTQVEDGGDDDDDGEEFELDPAVYYEDVEPATYDFISSRSVTLLDERDLHDSTAFRGRGNEDDEIFHNYMSSHSESPLEERDLYDSIEDTPTFQGRGNEDDEVFPDYVSRRSVDTGDDDLYVLKDDKSLPDDDDSGYYSFDNSSEDHDEAENFSGGLDDDDEDLDGDAETPALERRGSTGSSKSSSGSKPKAPSEPKEPSQPKSPSQPKPAPQDKNQPKPPSPPQDQSQSQSKISLSGLAGIAKKLPSVVKKVPSVIKKVKPPKVTNPLKKKPPQQKQGGGDAGGDTGGSPPTGGDTGREGSPPSSGSGHGSGSGSGGGSDSGSGSGHGSGGGTGTGSGSPPKGRSGLTPDEDEHGNDAADHFVKPKKGQSAHKGAGDGEHEMSGGNGAEPEGRAGSGRSGSGDKLPPQPGPPPNKPLPPTPGQAKHQKQPGDIHFGVDQHGKIQPQAAPKGAGGSSGDRLPPSPGGPPNKPLPQIPKQNLRQPAAAGGSGGTYRGRPVKANPPQRLPPAPNRPDANVPGGGVHLPLRRPQAEGAGAQHLANARAQLNLGSNKHVSVGEDGSGRAGGGGGFKPKGKEGVEDGEPFRRRSVNIPKANIFPPVLPMVQVF